VRAAGRLAAFLFVAALGGAFVWALSEGGVAELLTPLAAVRSMGPLAPVAFILGYSLGVVAFIPASLLTLAGGALFGVWRAVPYSLAGAYLGHTVAFLIGRYLARHRLERWLDTMPRLQAINRAVAKDARRIIFLLRLSPVMPFSVFNYALGATHIRLRDFSIGSAGMLPNTILYSYAGALAGQALALAGRAEVPHTTSYYVLLVAGLVATAAVTAVVGRTARHALRSTDLGKSL
jgi:uncharacterized membrane protein YdjX (TVP38/TMEM64 family)